MVNAKSNSLKMNVYICTNRAFVFLVTVLQEKFPLNTEDRTLSIKGYTDGDDKHPAFSLVIVSLLNRKQMFKTKGQLRHDINGTVHSAYQYVSVRE